MTVSNRPLAGLTVADFSRVLAGPYATQRLGDLGADVVKVERPGEGDETRSWGPPFRNGRSSYFTSVNRGKRSLAVDLGTEEGREVAAALCRASDVVVHNFRPSTAGRLGLDHASLVRSRPDAISCVISGFGTARVPSGRPGYDLVVQAESGLMAITGKPEGAAIKVGVAVVDVLAGLEAATAILAALAGRDRQGGGAAIEVPLLDSAFAAMVNVAQGALDTGDEPLRHGNDHPSIVPYGPFAAADGRIVVAAANDGLWARLCEAIGAPDLGSDPRYARNPDRVENRAELGEHLDRIFLSRPAAEWIDLLGEAGVPCGRVVGVIDALAGAEAAGEAVTVELDDGVEVIGPPARFGGERLHSPAGPPALGEHTDEVLARLGYDREAIDRLHRSAVVA